MNLTGIRRTSIAVVIGLAVMLVSLAVLGASPAAVQAGDVSDTAVLVDGAVNKPGQPPPEQIASQPYLTDDLIIFVGGSTLDPEDLAWVIEDDKVYEVDDEGGLDLVFSIVGDALVGRETCISERGAITENVSLRDAAGEVLFTVKGRHLWYGAVDVPNEGSSGWETVHSQRAYDVWHNQFYPGPKGKTDATISATADIHKASDLGKLAIMALVEGECGSSGLDPRPTPQ